MTDIDSSGWVDRWRASRGSPPATPPGDALDLLALIPDELMAEIASATGDEVERVQWWKSIAHDPAREQLAALRMTQVAVYRALREGGPMTDDELVTYMGRKKSETGPRRVELVRLGLIREVEKRATPAGRRAAAWGVVPHDEVAGAKQVAREKGLRRKHLDDYSLAEQLQIVQYLIKKDEVNDALLGEKSRSKAKDRARREARNVQADRDRARRDFNERVRQAEREASPQLVFLKAVGVLRRAADAVREIDRVIEENLDNYLLFGSADIAPEHWPEVRQELQQVIALATSADRQLAKMLEDDDALVVDFDEFDEAEVLELEPVPDDGDIDE